MLGTHSPTFAPYGAFRARDGWFVLSGAGSEDMWQRCCRSLGLEHLVTDPRFADNAARVEARDALTTEIEKVTLTRDVEDWLSVLDADGVPAGRINDLGDVLSGEQVAALGTVQHLDHPKAGRYPLVGVPVRVDDEALPVPSPAPLLGEHTRAVLLEAGLDAAAVDALVRSGTAVEP